MEGRQSVGCFESVRADRRASGAAASADLRNGCVYIEFAIVCEGFRNQCDSLRLRQNCQCQVHLRGAASDYVMRVHIPRSGPLHISKRNTRTALSISTISKSIPKSTTCGRTLALPTFCPASGSRPESRKPPQQPENYLLMGFFRRA